MAARLTTPGGDKGNRGKILNDFLRVVHNADGSLKDVVRPVEIGQKADKSDLASKTDTADLGTASAQDVEAFATAEQGEQADTAAQPEALETKVDVEAVTALTPGPGEVIVGGEDRLVRSPAVSMVLGGELQVAASGIAQSPRGSAGLDGFGRSDSSSTPGVTDSGSLWFGSSGFRIRDGAAEGTLPGGRSTARLHGRRG